MISMVDSVVLAKFDRDVEETLTEAIKLTDDFGALKSPFIIKPNICTDTDKTGLANTNLDLIET